MADKRINLMPHAVNSLRAALRGVKGRKILDAAIQRTGSDSGDCIEVVRLLLDDGTELSINGVVVMERGGEVLSAHNHYQTEEKVIPLTGVSLIRENSESINLGFWKDRATRAEWEAILATIPHGHDSDKR